jgi:hypothetical protein
LTVGPAIASTFDDWSAATTAVAAALLWAGWFAGVVALLAPRPWGFAALRVVAPVAVVVAVAADADAGGWALAIVGALVAAVLTLGAPIARASANSLAYGTEDRYPLTVPPMLAALPLPLAVAVVACGISAGPLLLADGRVAPGIGALVVGLPAAALATNSIYSLSRRWLVLVPAGAVVVDPLTLADPALFVREQVATVAPGRRPVDVDLRLGATHGALVFALHAPAPLARRGARGGAAMASARSVAVAVVDRGTFLVEARRRKLPVAADARADGRGNGSDQAAVPPPSTTSPA